MSNPDAANINGSAAQRGVMTYYWSGLPVTVIEKINLLVDSLLKQMQDCAVGYWGMRIVATDMAVVSC